MNSKNKDQPWVAVKWAIPVHVWQGQPAFRDLSLISLPLWACDLEQANLFKPQFLLSEMEGMLIPLPVSSGCVCVVCVCGGGLKSSAFVQGAWSMLQGSAPHSHAWTALTGVSRLWKEGMKLRRDGGSERSWRDDGR